ncbi:MAG TPA: YlbF family regulator [Candidatus Limiplasma sp.]|nr:YlbF family regulator [Candidatus Limiplasma sp.]HPS82013.1 YlbF family regulator [Candidatus Limiplasma sp.]
MEKVLNQAEQLAESILESEEFIKMRLAEQAAMRDAVAAGLIAEYSERRARVENLLASSDLDHAALSEAGAQLDATQKAIDENTMLQTMREANDVFSHMMQQVNKIIKFVVTGESEEADGCTGSCDSCGGGCGHQH